MSEQPLMPEEIGAQLRGCALVWSVSPNEHRRALRQLQAQAAELERLTAERDALARFKEWVHAYLDQRGIPTHPDGPHSREGCRVGDRMDYVFSHWLDDVASLMTDRDAARALAAKLAEALEVASAWRCDYGFPEGESCIGQVRKPCGPCAARAALAECRAAGVVSRGGL